MGTFIAVILVALFIWWLVRGNKPSPKVPADVSMLPERFVVYDLETTGLYPERNEIIEIGAILVNRDSNEHLTFQTLVQPRQKVPKKIIELTGITNEMIAADGITLDEALSAFRDFVGDLPLVAYNAEFDDAFLRAACQSLGQNPLTNEVCCALKLARKAWPNREGYRLADIARDGNLSAEDTHRALGDCRRTMIVYSAAASVVGTYR